MFCNKCGTQVADDRSFCPNCGNPMNSAQQAAPQYQQAAPQYQQAPPQYQQAPPQYQQAPPQYRQAAPQYQQQGGALDIKELILAIILVLCGAMAIVTFCFNLITASMMGSKAGISGFAAMFGGLSESGYSSYVSVDNALTVIFVIFLWLIFVLALGVLALTVINLISVILKRNILKINLDVFKLTVIAVGVISLVYIIIGAVLTIATNAAVQEMIAAEYYSGIGSISSFFGSSMPDYSSMYSIFTSAYWPFIIQALLIGGYIIVDKVVHIQPAARATAAGVSGAQPVQQGAPAYAAPPRRRNVDTVEEIKKYKELYDMGAITWEEYEAKKKEFLM